MADKDDDKNLAEGEGAPKKKPLLLIIIGAVVLLGAGAGGAFFLLGGEKSDEAAQTEVAEQEKVKPPVYYPLDPPLVVNFEQGARARYLQITLEVMAREKQVIEDLKIHMPVVRNNLNLLFSSQDYQQISTREGKEELRNAALLEVQKVMEEHTGKPGVEAVYFTSFVMQ